MSIARPRAIGFLLSCLSCLCATPQLVVGQAEASDDPNSRDYRALVAGDAPIFWESFDDTNFDTLRSNEVGQVLAWGRSPRSPQHRNFSPDNLAGFFDGASYRRYGDDEADDRWQFHDGEAITIEAWVMPLRIQDGQQIYVVGKGRTNRSGVARDNQNYALRLRGSGGQACLSFLFRDVDNRNGNQADFHRWTSSRGIALDERWHHIAISYRFGAGDSLRGYLDGQPIDGSWDLGGASDEAPVVDTDEIWVGSSMGGNPQSSFYGGIDEVAIYRGELSAAAIAKRVDLASPPTTLQPIQIEALPAREVVVEISEGLNAERLWESEHAQLVDQFRTPEFALIDLPQKYLDGAIRGDRPVPYLVRLQAKVELPEGDHQFLLRAKSATRLWINGELLCDLPFMSKNASGHEQVPELIEPLFSAMHPVAAGHQESLLTWTAQEVGTVHVLLETVVGGRGVRAELGEVCLAVASNGETTYRVLAPEDSASFPLTEPAWQRFRRRQQLALAERDRVNRHLADQIVAQYWAERHEFARQQTTPVSLPDSTFGYDERNEIDRFLNVSLANEGIEPAEQIDDYQFLRRVSLDTIGVPPSLEEWETYLADPVSERRSLAIDRLLNDDRWADHWVAYWQDVLAENPGILKAEQNNTGPFRYWIHESFVDNKPLDRFATELVQMRGSVYGGGPAGFRLATQNDVPMAAKALVVSQAFLGVQMKCARCHDSPLRDATQSALFGMAAMLERRPIVLPPTSSVPLSEHGRTIAIPITLQPGDSIAPHWPFEENQTSLSEVEPHSDDTTGLESSANLRWIRYPGDSREVLAWRVTSPSNPRFARVMVNRIWHRWMGRGIVDPVDDWQSARPTHPLLLDYLASELTRNRYDLKHVARLILNSAAYQRGQLADSQVSARWFASQQPRRLTAEQIVDSLYCVVGKGFDCESITFDPEGRRPASTFLNLGHPQRAWEFASLSNERDRPALALPRAQAIIDLLVGFGWREARTHGLSDRQVEVQLVQPLTLANGIAMHRLCQVSDNGAIVNDCLDAESPTALVERLSLRLLGRPPAPDQLERLARFLEPGFATRVRQAPRQPFVPFALYRTNVSWSNHLSPEASEIMLELEQAARLGDPVTARLEPEWRERVEDLVWAMLNSPEFQFR